MENSRKSNCSNLPQRVADALAPVVPEGGSILLGLSGGVDSVVLLHLLHQLSSQHTWRLSALHVHHGISPLADSWAALCSGLCARLSIPLKIERVDITPLRGLGIEAAARKLRHAALARQQVDVVAVAHHLDDQAETILLQLLRGAGVKGAAAMPLAKSLAENTPSPLLVRPLLDVPRSTLLEYAQVHDLQWVEDESNADDIYPRNFLRHRILPFLEQRFPAYRETLARSASHFAEASEMLDELARQDAMRLFPSPLGEGARGEGCTYEDEKQSLLEVVRLQSLSPPRAKNLLRYFLSVQGVPMPESKQLDEMLHQLCHARTDAAVRIVIGPWQVRRYQNKVYALPTRAESAANFCAEWHGEPVLEFPELGSTLVFEPSLGQGLSLAKLQQKPVSIHTRRGGETFMADAARPRRTLKNLLQESGIPPWQRDRLPLLFCGDDLVCVPGIGTEVAYQAQLGEQGVLVNWLGPG